MIKIINRIGVITKTFRLTLFKRNSQNEKAGQTQLQSKEEISYC